MHAQKDTQQEKGEKAQDKEETQGTEYDPDLYDKQSKELEAEMARVRMRAFYIQRPAHSTAPFGLTVSAGTRSGSSSEALTVPVVVSAIDPAGIVAKDGSVKLGDRLVKINGQWLADTSHAQYLLEVLADEPALDLTVARGEPLPAPPSPPLSSLSDQQLQDAAFEHCGLRILVHPTQGWSRAAALAKLAERFDADAAAASSSSSSPQGKGEGKPTTAAAAADVASGSNATSTDSSDDNGQSANAASTDSSGVKSALKKTSSYDGSADSKSKKSKKKGRAKKTSVSFREDKPTVHETYSKFDYHRPLDPGHGFSDLRSLFNYNTDRMEQEQLREAEAYVDSRRLYGHYVVRAKSTKPFGFKLRPITKDLNEPYLFLEGVEIVDIARDGAVAQHGGIKEGDRLVKVNGQWVLNHQHAEYLVFEVLRRAKALDLTVTRGEPLAPSFDLSSKTDEELLDLAFEHGGYRVAIGEGQCTRDEVVLMIRKRLATTGSNNPALSNLYRTASTTSRTHSDEEC